MSNDRLQLLSLLHDDKHFIKKLIENISTAIIFFGYSVSLLNVSSAEFAKSNSDSHIVKCRGLPWSAKSEDLAVFFSGCDIKGGKSVGVHFLKNDEGRQC